MQKRNEEDIHPSLRLTTRFQRTGRDATEKQWILGRYWFPTEQVMFSQLDVGINIERLVQRKLFNTDDEESTRTSVLDILASVTEWITY